MKEYGVVDWDSLDRKIKDVAIDLRYRGDYTTESRVLLQKFIADNDLEKFKAILADQSKWSRVPSDRFLRRKNFLNGV